MKEEFFSTKNKFCWILDDFKISKFSIINVGGQLNLLEY